MFKPGDVIQSKNGALGLIIYVDYLDYKVEIIKAKKFKTGFVGYFNKQRIDQQCILSPKHMLRQRLSK